MPENKIEINQIIQSIKKAKKIGIILPDRVSLDVFCAGLALQRFISQYHLGSGEVQIISSAENLPQTQFLGFTPVLYSDLNSTNELAIKISGQHHKPSEIRYEKNSDGVTVFVKAEGGFLSQKDISILTPLGEIDLFIVLGASSLDYLGRVFDNNAKVIYETTKINIDINPLNEYFGSVNLVQTNVSSICEIIYQIIEETQEVKIDADIATMLLAGIINETEGYRGQKTTPQSLLRSSQLVSLGAQQQEIIRYLYKTKTLSHLQLWGRALARTTIFPNSKTVLSFVTYDDLVKTNNVEELTSQTFVNVLKDLISMTRDCSLAVLLVEKAKENTIVLLGGAPHRNIKSIITRLISGQSINSDIIYGELLDKKELLIVEVPLSFQEIQNHFLNFTEESENN